MSMPKAIKAMPKAIKAMPASGLRLNHESWGSESRIGRLAYMAASLASFPEFLAMKFMVISSSQFLVCTLGESGVGEAGVEGVGVGGGGVSGRGGEGGGGGGGGFGSGLGEGGEDEGSGGGAAPRVTAVCATAESLAHLSPRLCSKANNGE